MMFTVMREPRRRPFLVSLAVHGLAFSVALRPAAESPKWTASPHLTVTPLYFPQANIAVASERSTKPRVRNNNVRANKMSDDTRMLMPLASNGVAKGHAETTQLHFDK